MTIGIVLNYFDYFLNFPKYDEENEYIFITANKRYKSYSISNLKLFQLADYVNQDWGESTYFEFYFAFGIKSKSIKYPIDLPVLARIYEVYFEKLFEETKIDILLTGGVSGFERCAIRSAKKSGVKTLVIWEGFFRSNTISYDKYGMNAESSISDISLDEVLKKNPSNYNKVRYQKHLEYFKSSQKKNLNSSISNVYDKSISQRFFRRMAERDFFERPKIPISSLLLSYFDYLIHKNRYLTLTAVNKPFLFFPLPVHTDSNYLINSNFETISETVELVKTAFLKSKIANEFNLCIKEHPLDVLRIRYPIINSYNVVWLNPLISTTEIINNRFCYGTITINSTVGFESLMLGKPVLALGKAVYTKNGLCDFDFTGNLEKITLDIECIERREVSDENIYKFGCFLLDNHQWEGNLSSIPSKNEIQQILNTIST